MSALIRRALMPSLLVLGLAVVGTPAYAQTGQVKGKVVDAKNQPVEKAEVIIEATDGMGRKFKVTTNRRGEHIQIGLPPGQCKITASKDNLSDSREQRIGLDAAEVNLTLRAGGAGGDMSPAEEAKKAASQECRHPWGLRSGRKAEPGEQARRSDRQVQRSRRAGAQVRRVPDEHRLAADGQEGLRGGRGHLQEGHRAESELRRGLQRPGEPL